MKLLPYKKKLINFSGPQQKSLCKRFNSFIFNKSVSDTTTINICTKNLYYSKFLLADNQTIYGMYVTKK